MEQQGPKDKAQSSDYHTLVDDGEHYSRIQVDGIEVLKDKT